MAEAEMVHLVRHGEVHNPQHLVYASLPGFRLSPLGVQQTRRAGRYLAGRPLRAVWSSPLERALQTAETLAAPHRLEVRVLPGLVEWKLMDRWAGHRWEHLPELFPGEVEAYLRRPSDLAFGPESLRKLAERIATAVRRASATVSGGEIAVVGHQDPLQAGRLLLTGRSLEELFRDRPQHCSVITLRPGEPWTEVGMWSPPSR